DLAEHLATTEAQAREAQTAAKRARTRATSARTTASGTAASPADQFQKADREAKAAEQTADDAEASSAALMERVKSLRLIAEADALARDGKLAFSPEAPLPKVIPTPLKDAPTAITVGRIGVAG